MFWSASAEREPNPATVLGRRRRMDFHPAGFVHPVVSRSRLPTLAGCRRRTLRLQNARYIPQKYSIFFFPSNFLKNSEKIEIFNFPAQFLKILKFEIFWEIWKFEIFWKFNIFQFSHSIFEISKIFNFFWKSYFSKFPVQSVKNFKKSLFVEFRNLKFPRAIFSKISKIFNFSGNFSIFEIFHLIFS